MSKARIAYSICWWEILSCCERFSADAGAPSVVALGADAVDAVDVGRESMPWLRVSSASWRASE
eukprot:5493066-Pyramimonas_sp.AAC.2